MPDRIVVCNTTPIIALSRAGELLLLKKMYGEIVIPQAVYDELTAKEDSVSQDVRDNASWLRIAKVQNTKIITMFSVSLHTGEVETIMLADEMKADLVIIDDLLARKYALQAGLNLTGTMGVLLKAKREGLIETIKPLLDSMIENGIYVSERLYRGVLALANENIG